MARGKKAKSKKPGAGKADVTPLVPKAAAAEPATVPSTPGSMNAPAARQLTDEHLAKMRERFVRLYGELEAHEESAKDLVKQAAEERAEAKRIREELHQLREAINTGVESARQGDMFAHQQRPRAIPGGPHEEDSNAHAASPAQTDKTLAEIGQRGEELLAKGGETPTASAGQTDAFDFSDDEPPPTIDATQAGQTRVEAEREEPAETGA